MRDICIIQSTRYSQLLSRVTRQSTDTDCKTVGCIILNAVTVNIRPNSFVIHGEWIRREFFLILRRVEIRFLETIRTGCNGCISTERNLIVRNRRARVDDLDRINNLRNRFHQNLTTTITDISVVDMIQEYSVLGIIKSSLVGTIHTMMEQDTAPVTRFCFCRKGEGIESNGFIVI